MANWVKCTAYGEGSAVFVNLDQVSNITRHSDATRIQCGSGENCYIFVEDTPREILDMESITHA